MKASLKAAIDGVLRRLGYKSCSTVEHQINDLMYLSSVTMRVPIRGRLILHNLNGHAVVVKTSGD